MNKPIQIFNRHCAFSTVSQNKERPSWFSREICHKNLLRTMNKDLCDLHIIYDQNRGSIKDHFLSKYEHNLYIVNAGSEGQSFINVLNYINSFKFSDDTIIYIVEDDYLHRALWSEVILEGISLINNKFDGKGFGSLYSHPDKMDESVYPNLFSRIFCSESSYWRTTPSTTNTYFGSAKTFRKTDSFQKKFSQDHFISLDHAKFIGLGELGYNLITPMPGFSTHCETAYLGNVVKWNEIAI